MCHWLFWNAAKDRDYRSAAILGGKLIACDRLAALKVTSRVTWAAMRRAVRLPQKKTISATPIRRSPFAGGDIPTQSSAP
jgi:hypothetical protein